MIGKDQIAEAARNADAHAEELGLPDYCKQKGIDLEGLAYVAQQRAMRAVAVSIDGRPPETFQNMRERRVIRLSPLAERLVPILAATWMDAFTAGLTAKEAGE